MTKILKGKDVADALNLQNLTAIETLKEHHIIPTLVTIRLGDRPDDVAYGASIVKKAKALGIEVQECLYPENMTQKALENRLLELNRDKDVHGVLLFRPLPPHMDEKGGMQHSQPRKGCGWHFRYFYGKSIFGKSGWVWSVYGRICYINSQLLQYSHWWETSSRVGKKFGHWEAGFHDAIGGKTQR